MANKSDIIDPISEAVDTYGWVQFYLGAFAALGVSNTDMATDLAKLTRSDMEAIHAVATMRDAPHGDRVYPALEWLRETRRTGRS